MENICIRKALKQTGVNHWEIAEALGISEATMCRWLRRELPADKREHMLKTIERIAEYKREQEVKHREA